MKQKINILMALIFMIFFMVTPVRAIYDSEGQQGYYQQGNEGFPCHSSGRTGESSAQGDSGEKYMFYNSSAGKCQYGPSGEFYNPVYEAGEDCKGSGKYQGRYQSQCNEGPEGQFFDLEAMNGVATCPTHKIKILSSVYNIQSVGREVNYYIDPLSTEILELGTLEFPYRTMNSISMEIVNFFSHSNMNITIHTKDVYLEQDKMILLNITEVKITTHPEYEMMSRKAVIISTSIPQPVISEKASLHLLKNSSFLLNEQISKGNFMESELALLGFQGVSILAGRSSIWIENIDIYSEDSEYTILPAKLEDKSIKGGKFV